MVAGFDRGICRGQGQQLVTDQGSWVGHHGVDSGGSGEGEWGRRFVDLVCSIDCIDFGDVFENSGSSGGGACGFEL